MLRAVHTQQGTEWLAQDTASEWGGAATAASNRDIRWGTVLSSDWHTGTTLAQPWPAPAPLAPGLFPSGVNVPLLRGERAHTEREQNHPAPKLQGFCSSMLGVNPVPNRVVTTTEHRSSGSNLALAPAPRSPAPPPSKVTAASPP